MNYYNKYLKYKKKYLKLKSIEGGFRAYIKGNISNKLKKIKNIATSVSTYNIWCSYTITEKTHQLINWRTCIYHIIFNCALDQLVNLKINKLNTYFQHNIIIPYIEEIKIRILELYDKIKNININVDILNSDPNLQQLLMRLGIIVSVDDIKDDKKLHKMITEFTDFKGWFVNYYIINNNIKSYINYSSNDENYKSLKIYLSNFSSNINISEFKNALEIALADCDTSINNNNVNKQLIEFKNNINCLCTFDSQFLYDLYKSKGWGESAKSSFKIISRNISQIIPKPTNTFSQVIKVKQITPIMYNIFISNLLELLSLFNKIFEKTYDSILCFEAGNIYNTIYAMINLDYSINCIITPHNRAQKIYIQKNSEKTNSTGDGTGASTGADKGDDAPKIIHFNEITQYNKTKTNAYTGKRYIYFYNSRSIYCDTKMANKLDNNPAINKTYAYKHTDDKKYKCYFNINHIYYREIYFLLKNQSHYTDLNDMLYINNNKQEYYINICVNNGDHIEDIACFSQHNNKKIDEYNNINYLSILQSRILNNTNQELLGNKVSLFSLITLFDNIIKDYPLLYYNQNDNQDNNQDYNQDNNQE